MSWYPIQVDLRGKRCVVVGGGAVAERRVAGLHECGALVRLVAPEATAALEQRAAAGEILWVRSLYNDAHLDGAFLVIAATDQRDVNAAVARDAEARGLLVCRADDADAGNFTVPGMVVRGDLVLTVTTSGRSPTLAAVVRQRLGESFGPEWTALTALLGGLREDVKSVGDEVARRAAVSRMIDDAALREDLRSGRILEAEVRARECLSSSSG